MAQKNGKKRSASISNQPAKRVKDKDTEKSANSAQKEAGNGQRNGNSDEINVISDSDSEEDPEIELGTCENPDGDHGDTLTAYQNGSVKSGPHQYMHSINLHPRLNITMGAVVMSSPVHRGAANSAVVGF
jgi:hypothetical protein